MMDKVKLPEMPTVEKKAKVPDSPPADEKVKHPDSSGTARKPPSYPGATVAVVISVLGVGPSLFDGAAVLAESVRQVSSS